MTYNNDRKSVNAQIQTAVGGDGNNLLGFWVHWSTNGVRFTEDELGQAFDRYGLDKGRFFPPEITTPVAARKAVELLNPGRDHKVEVIVDDDSEIVWGIGKLRKDKANKDFALNAEARITFDCVTEKMSASGVHGTFQRRLADEAVSNYQWLTYTFINKDVQKLLRNAVVGELGATMLKRNGGLYFVTAGHEDVLNKLQGALESCGRPLMNGDTPVEVSITSIANNNQNRRSVGRDVRHGLMAEIEAHLKKAKEYRDSGRKTQEGTLQKRIEDYKELRAKGQLYAQMLGMRVDEINETLDDCEHIVQNLLGCVQTEKQERAEKAEATAQANGNASGGKGFMKVIRRLRKVERAA